MANSYKFSHRMSGQNSNSDLRGVRRVCNHLNCVEISEVIKSTGLPNNGQKCYPILSGLNTKARKVHSSDYPDKNAQCLTYGFPLSLTIHD